MITDKEKMIKELTGRLRKSLAHIFHSAHYTDETRILEECKYTAKEIYEYTIQPQLKS